jgi:hypothetical protein
MEYNTIITLDSLKKSIEDLKEIVDLLKSNSYHSNLNI